MMKINMPAWRKPILAVTLGLGFWAAPMAIASTAQCASIQNPIQKAQCECLAGQKTYADQTGSIVAQQHATDPYLSGLRTVTPGDTASLGAGLSQTCSQMTQGAFESLMNGVNLFGFNLSSVFGGSAGAIGGSLCQKISNAIVSTTKIPCPSVAIPGFPLNCGATVSVGLNGVTVAGSGNVAGATFSGSGTAGANGVSTQTGGSTSGVPSVVSNAVGNATGGVLSNITKNVQCWISGNCPPAN